MILTIASVTLMTGAETVTETVTETVIETAMNLKDAVTAIVSVGVSGTDCVKEEEDAANSSFKRLRPAVTCQ